MLVYIICWIVVIIVAYFCYLYFKSEFKRIFGIQDKDKNKNSNYEMQYEEKVEEPSIDGTIAVDKMIVHKLQCHDTLNFGEQQLTTSTSYNASDIYDRINDLIKHSSRIADELRRNESKLVSGNSSSSIEGFEATMSNYDVEINLIGWTINMSLGQLQTLSSVDDLRGKIDDGFILGREAFYAY
ncbi:hypothetical protein D0402_02320 [Staphylococcus epidermidis]|uniref:hypothetical protein n=2 Tax=Staphylococcus epidermidis TaxID=1282 RepID=UPI00193388BB|nr:hypothetical protein [Staphylococcus epidermidis]MBM0751723.1 hypothetical protein [Staphylococcus epidermidis]MBM0780714.1 hypothetical protein [Staphylococcus epidermidis]